MCATRNRKTIRAGRGSGMDELTPAELATLSSALDMLDADLRAQLAASEQGARPVDLDEPIGRLSRMEAMQQQSMTQANRRAAQLRLQLVAAAKTRIERDEYGECAECGEAVGFKRLVVRPEAPLCIGCQGLREQR
jgi:DnaK suppressor protein